MASNPPGSKWRSTRNADRGSPKPPWTLPKATIDHVAEQARLAGVRPSRWARVALELVDPEAVAARLAELDGAS